jgi:RimJ/RimL family protein N-acetyltransferase/catechol 2,3-dioxygenase-like lactoylglutathione lyase family enzyme
VTADRPELRIEPLTTDRLELTPLDPSSDAPALHSMLSDPEVHRYDIDAQPSTSVSQTERRLRLEVMANGNTTWAIRLKGGHPIGTIGIFADQQTTTRGVGWSLKASYWGQHIMSEAARVAVPYLLAQDGVDGLEAWVDSRNLGSLGVARAAGMSERGRLPRAGRDHVGQTVVMTRAAVPVDPEVLGVTPTLVVADLAETVRVLQKVLALHVAWEVPDPPTLVFLAVEPWAGSPGLRVAQGSGALTPTELLFEIGISVDVVRARVVSAGLTIESEPVDQPWARRELAFRLPDGHVIRVSGPSSPEGA